MYAYLPNQRLALQQLVDHEANEQTVVEVLNCTLEAPGEAFHAEHCIRLSRWIIALISVLSAETACEQQRE